MQDTRRNPDAFLALFKEEEQAEKTHGRLKIFFGYAPGVGKTYGMLEDARKLKAENVDVVVGIVETHGREATRNLLEGLEQLEHKTFEYRGHTLREFDLDAALKRKPQVVLVDEAAHTNAPGSRHEKRWQDVEELLNNGIDVFTTLNAQHIETLNDRVAQITKIEVRERVPDSFVEKAFEIELVDLPVDELLQRLKEGKVYIPEQAATALENFFRKGNLIALREIALLFVAQRVDAQMERYRELHCIKAVWPAGDRILVCVSASPLTVRLVRAAKRMANALRAQWYVQYVETPAQMSASEEDKARVIQTLRLAEQLGAEILETSGASVSEEIIKTAKQLNISKIVIGKPARPRWIEILYGSVVDEIIRKSGAIDVYVMTGEEGDSASPTHPFKWPRRTTPISKYWMTVALVSGCTVLAIFLRSTLAPINIVMIYLVCVVFVSLNYGRGPSILASILGVGAFDFFCIPPYHTFAVSDSEYILTFAVMLSVALIISTLTVRVKQQAEAAGLRERRTASVYSMSRELASSRHITELLEIGLRHIGDLFEAQVAILLPDEKGHLRSQSVLTGVDKHALESFDVAVAEWVLHNGKMAGMGTNTLPAAAALYMPLTASSRVMGVLAIKPVREENISRPEQFQLLQTFVNQLSQACERAYLAEENEKARVQMKTEQLRSSLLSSVSHDLRTPLATITGAASSIVEAPETLDIESCRERASEIYQESVRLNRLVTNLLEMTRLQSGTLSVAKEWHPVDEIIGAALNCLDDRLVDREVKSEISEQSLMVHVDATLIQQVLLNLLDNALKYSPEGSSLVIAAARAEDSVIISVCDLGPGIPQESKERIFQKFFRDAPDTTFGAGLGLAICAGIVEAHGGSIWVEDNPGGGSIFCFTLPIDEEEPELDPDLLAE